MLAVAVTSVDAYPFLARIQKQVFSGCTASADSM